MILRILILQMRFNYYFTVLHLFTKEFSLKTKFVFTLLTVQTFFTGKTFQKH